MSFFGNNPNTGFGRGAQPSAFGSSFGTPQNTGFGNAPTTGFGTSQSTGFGGSATNPVFGTPQQPSLFGAATSTGFGQPTFGAPSNSVFRTAPTFGSSQLNNAFSNFGTNTNTNSPFAFNPATTTTGFGTTNTGFGTGQNTQQNSGFGGTFGTPQQSAFSGFGANPASSAFSFNTPAFGQQMQPQQQQQFQQPQINENHAFYQSIFQCFKFGDERDGVLANLNYVQACLGRGRGYYSQTLPPVVYTPTNPCYRFKAVGYSFVFLDSNEDGQVILTINKSPDKIQSEETQIISCFQTLFNQPNLLFKICAIKAVGNESNVILVTYDKNTNRRIPAYDLATALSQPFVKSQLDNLGILSVIPKVKPSPEQIQQYLENPPIGIDPRVWRKAQEDNPFPSSLIPVPIIGIDGLNKKVLWQDSESQQHQATIKLIQEEISAITSRYDTLNMELEQLKRRNANTAHRILKVIGRYDVAKKGEMPLQPEEQELQIYLQTMESEINKPTEHKGQITEMLSKIRLQRLKSPAVGGRTEMKCDLNKEIVSQVKDFLAIQHKSTKHLVETTCVDQKNLNRLKTEIVGLDSEMKKP